jgi:hypothetical protein
MNTFWELIEKRASMVGSVTRNYSKSTIKALKKGNSTSAIWDVKVPFSMSGYDAKRSGMYAAGRRAANAMAKGNKTEAKRIIENSKYEKSLLSMLY